MFYVGDSIFEHNNWYQSEVGVTGVISIKNGPDFAYCPDLKLLGIEF